MRSPVKRGFTLIELLVVIAIIAILASILFPVFSKARSKARQAQCNSNVRQLALAVQMYAQDNNGAMPSKSWDNDIAGYVGNSGAMFQCPEDTAGNNSYAFNGVLLDKNGQGVKEAAIKSPSEVAALADASPSAGSRIIGGGAGLAIDKNGATIEGRHAKGAIVGFADGHSKYFGGPFNDLDLGNGATRAFWGAAHLGLVDNPIACFTSGDSVAAAVTSSQTIWLGGDYNARPLLLAAGQSYGNYFDSGFRGATATGIGATPSTGNWVLATSGPATPVNPAVAGADTIAYDALCVIVAKGTKLSLGSMSNGTYSRTTGEMATLFQTASTPNTLQVYKMPSAQTATSQIDSLLTIGTWGTDNVEVANDAEMVEKVSNDPYGIGYCSTVFADPDRVLVLSVGAEQWPRNGSKNRWVLPAIADSSWPWLRTIDVTDSGAAGTDIGQDVANQLRTGGAFMDTLKTGPLFKGNGYWPL